MRRVVRWGFFLALLSPALIRGADISSKIEGNSFFGDRRLQNQFPLTPEEGNDESVLFWKQDAIDAMLDLYEENGFFDILIEGDITHIDPETERAGERKWEVVFRIEEGVRYTYGEVSIIAVSESSDPLDEQGEAVSSLDTLEAPVTIDPRSLSAQAGRPLQRDNVHKDVRHILRRYGDAGFVRAEVEERLSLRADSPQVDVAYIIAPSYPVVFDTLIILNLPAVAGAPRAGITPEKVMRDLVPYNRGDTVRISQSNRLIEKLQSTAVFTYVRMKDSLLSDAGDRSALILDVRENVPGRVHSSLFYETQFGAGVSADVEHGNFLGTLKKVGVGAVFARQKQGFRARYGSPLTFGQLLRFDNTSDINWYQDDEYAQAGFYDGKFRATNSSSLSRPVTSWSHFRSGAEVEWDSRPGILERQREILLNFVNTYAMDFLDQPLNPNRGTRLALTWGNGGPLYPDRQIAFWNYRHNWLQAQSAAYLPLLFRTSLAARLDGGFFFQDGGLNAERFWLGGARSVRSFGYNQLCPETEFDPEEPAKGSICRTDGMRPAYYLASLEFHFGIPSMGMNRRGNLWNILAPMRLVPFADYGRVWDWTEPHGKVLWLDGEEGPQWNGAGIAYGLGFRYPLFGIFNLRLDFAWGQNGRGDDVFQWVLDLAQAF